MTITSENNKDVYTGNGSTTIFAYTFKIFADTDLEVILQTIATGAEVTLTLTTDYTVSGAGNASGGNVTTVATYASTQKLIIRRNLAFTQGTDYVENSDFAAETHETALDRLNMLVLQLKESVDRAIVQSSEAVSTITFPSASADKFIGWDSGGTVLENKTPAGETTAQIPSFGAGDAEKVAKINSAGSAVELGLVDFANMSSLADMRVIGNTSGGATTPSAVSVLDEDTMSSDSSTALATQQSIKAYVDTNGANIIQVVNVMDGAVATGTTMVPVDDTIPQNTEGDEYMTLAITPTSATNKLKIDTIWYGSSSIANATYILGLFQDSTASALAVGTVVFNAINNIEDIVLTHYMTAGTTSATTFKVRVGSNSAQTTTFNGQSGSRRFGGVMASSITITEIKV